ncbi:MAG: M23 family metallopeptidase [Acidobacteria bacterium]|nr:M23 family metallopeptidase [Acidobacteriota bacterium]
MRIPRLLLVSLVVGVAACATNEPPPPPPAQDVFLEPDTTRVQGLVEPRTTLDAMLRAHGVAADVVGTVIEAASVVFDLRRLRAAQPFLLEQALGGDLRHFEYEIDADSYLRVMPIAAEADEFRAEVVPIPKTLEHGVAAGRIDASTPSLFQAMDATGERAELTLALAQVFSGEIDFNSEVQPGDRFAVAFERFVRDDRPSIYGVITAAEFENDGRRIRAVRFTPPGGEADYFDDEGHSLQRFFLRSPLKFEPRVTSRYSTRRMHPILRTARAHTGVDYGAPTGAAVVAVSNGTVVSATFDNANGRMVRLRHASGYETYYLHLSAFASGIRRGARVAQGQTIGAVGSTGLATGPHLHYGLKKNGAWVDPLREHRNMPPGDPVPPGAMEAFRAVRDAALEQLAAASSPEPLAAPIVATR